MPNAELFTMNPNRVMMISKCISNVQPALFYNLENLLKMIPDLGDTCTPHSLTETHCATVSIVYIRSNEDDQIANTL